MAKGIGSLLDVAEGTNGASPDRQTYRHLLKKLYSDLSDDEIEEIMRSTDFSAIPLPRDVDLMGVTPTSPPPGVTTAATFGGASADALAGPSPQLGEDTEVQSDSDWLENRRQGRAKRRGPFDRYLDQLLGSSSKGLLVQPSADPVVAEDPTETLDDRVQATAPALKELHQKYGTPTDADPVVAEDPQEDPPPPSASGDWWQRYLTQAQSMISGRGDERGIGVTDETPSTQGDPTAEADLTGQPVVSTPETSATGQITDTGETEAVKERARQLIGLGMDPKQAMDLARRMAGFGSPPGQQGIPLPKQDKPQTGLRLLEAAANIGQSLFANRAIRKAQKQDRASQARANLINALSSRGGARGTQTTPSEGRLGALLGGVKGISEAIRGGRQAETKASQDQFANRLKLRELGDLQLRRHLDMGKLGLRERELILKEEREQRIAREGRIHKSGSQLVRENDDGSVSVIFDGRDAKTPHTMETADKSIWQWMPDSKNKNAGEWVKIFDGKDVAAGEVHGDFIKRVEEMGRSAPDFDEILMVDRGFAAVYNSKSEEIQEAIRGAHQRGARLQAADVAKKLEAQAKKYNMVTSATERLQIADANTFQSELDRIYKEVPILDEDGNQVGTRVTGLWQEAGMRGAWYGIMHNWVGMGFDADGENPKSGFIARRIFESGGNLNDALAGFGLKIARILNGGRPSDRDLVAAARLLPLQSDSDSLAQKKMRFLQALFSERIVAIKEEQSRVQEGGGEYVPRTLVDMAEKFIQDNRLTADGQEMERDLGTTGGTVEGSESDFE
tara:strand:- start:2816 stop:5188 length:2373 start_codon:yes stop_codon:yes gene_type:complete